MDDATPSSAFMGGIDDSTPTSDFMSGMDESTPTSFVVCPQDVFECPDGSYVGRDGANNCEFYPCVDRPDVDPIPDGLDPIDGPPIFEGSPDDLGELPTTPTSVLPDGISPPDGPQFPTPTGGFAGSIGDETSTPLSDDFLPLPPVVPATPSGMNMVGGDSTPTPTNPAFVGDDLTSTPLADDFISDEPTPSSDIMMGIGNNTPDPVVCPEDAFTCTDGTTVSRDPLNDCKFPPCGFDEIGFDQASSTWSVVEPSDYSFNFRWSCFCPEETTRWVKITVESSAVASIEVVDTGEAVENGSTMHEYFTLSGLFDFISSRIGMDPVHMNVGYDETHGFIKNAYIDVSPDIIDEELGFEVSDFVGVLNPTPTSEGSFVGTETPTPPGLPIPPTPSIMMLAPTPSGGSFVGGDPTPTSLGIPGMKGGSDYVTPSPVVEGNFAGNDSTPTAVDYLETPSPSTGLPPLPGPDLNPPTV
jgi:hypothetical protein